MRGKVDRSIERSRRAAVRLLERAQANAGLPDDGRDAAKMLLGALVSIFERMSAAVGTCCDIYTSWVLTLFACLAAKQRCDDTPFRYAICACPHDD